MYCNYMYMIAGTTTYRMLTGASKYRMAHIVIRSNGLDRNKITVYSRAISSG